MPSTMTIKNIPQNLYEMLKQNAAINHRSINKEVIALIEDALSVKKVSPEDFLVSVRRLREKTKKVELTDDFIDQAKNEGRQ